jgi:hypothetical protein
MFVQKIFVVFGTSAINDRDDLIGFIWKVQKTMASPAVANNFRSNGANTLDLLGNFFARQRLGLFFVQTALFKHPFLLATRDLKGFPIPTSTGWQTPVHPPGMC